MPSRCTAITCVDSLIPEGNRRACYPPKNQVDPIAAYDGSVGDAAIADLYVDRIQNLRGVDSLQRSLVHS